MMGIVEWLHAGSPPHWELVALAAFLLVEWLLPRTERVEARSSLELLGNLLRCVPLVGRLATPKIPVIQPMPPPPSGASLRVLLPVLFAVGLSGCGTAYQASYATLATLERQVVAAAEELPRQDAYKQAAIVAAAKSLPEGEAALKAWRAKRGDGEKAIAGTHASIRLARDGVIGLEKGGDKGDPKALVNMAMRAVGNLAALLDAVGFDWKSLARLALGGM
jgi:hypothetical protein